MPWIFDIKSNLKKWSEVTPISSVIELSKLDTWNFDWLELFKTSNSKTYVLTTDKDEIQGAMNLLFNEELLIMNALELNPQNIGTNKKYDHVAGCLIATACKESFTLKGEYMGYVSFVSKTALIQLYKSKYKAMQIGSSNRMYFDLNACNELINKYL